MGPCGPCTKPRRRYIHKFTSLAGSLMWRTERPIILPFVGNVAAAAPYMCDTKSVKHTASACPQCSQTVEILKAEGDPRKGLTIWTLPRAKTGTRMEQPRRPRYKGEKLFLLWRRPRRTQRNTSVLKRKLRVNNTYLREKHFSLQTVSNLTGQTIDP